MNMFRKESAWDKVTAPLARVPGRSLAKSGLTAGAAVVALSVASAATSALRRRVERP
jgi:hypothetical protein